MHHPSNKNLTMFKSTVIPLFQTFVLATVIGVIAVSAENVPYDLNQETYKTETLFSYEGCSDHSLMGNSGQPRVYKNHVYLAIIAYGNVPRVLQIPLDGGEAKIGRLDPEFRIGNDSHKYFTLNIDKRGYIHLTGGMHGHPWRYWISEKPEDVSKFVEASGKQIPPGTGITYPQFFKDTAGNLYLHARGSVPSFQKSRPGKIVHIGLLSTYDADQRTWRLLGDDIPRAFGGKRGHPVTLWGDDFDDGSTGAGWYVKNTASFVSAPDNTLYFSFNILNFSPPNESLRTFTKSGGGGKDILYATSKDGGRTLQRNNGSQVKWPVRAEAGPYQPDVIYAAAEAYASMKKGDEFSGLTGGRIQLDWKNRPIIWLYKKITNEVGANRLEDGKWVSCPKEAFGTWRDNAGVLMNPIEGKGGKSQLLRLWDENHSRVVDFGPEIRDLDEDYLRDTGTMIYTTTIHRSRNVNVMRTTIQRPTPTKDNPPANTQ